MDWPLREMLVAAGITTISSSAIVAKVLVDLKRTANPETEMILGIIMFEDIFLAVYLTLVSGLVLSGASFVQPGGDIGCDSPRLHAGCSRCGSQGHPWLNRALDISSDEVFLLIIFATLLLVAGGRRPFRMAEALARCWLGWCWRNRASSAHRASRHPLPRFFRRHVFLPLWPNHRSLRLGRRSLASSGGCGADVDRQFRCWHAGWAQRQIITTRLLQHRTNNRIGVSSPLLWRT